MPIPGSCVDDPNLIKFMLESLRLPEMEDLPDDFPTQQTLDTAKLVIPQFMWCYEERHQLACPPPTITLPGLGCAGHTMATWFLEGVTGQHQGPELVLDVLPGGGQVDYIFTHWFPGRRFFTRAPNHLIQPADIDKIFKDIHTVVLRRYR